MVTYEPELFPALLLRRFMPVHVAVFHTGRCVLTGLRSLDQARDIMSQLNAYLNTLLDVNYFVCFHFIITGRLPSTRLIKTEKIQKFTCESLY